MDLNWENEKIENKKIGAFLNAFKYNKNRTKAQIKSQNFLHIYLIWN